MLLVLLDCGAYQSLRLREAGTASEGSSVPRRNGAETDRDRQIERKRRHKEGVRGKKANYSET